MGFDVHDILPYVSVPKGEQPIELERLEIAVVVSGMFAETSQTLTVRNRNRRALEGSLTFPLPEGAVVCGYAIDIDGELVDAVIVPKQEARRILETEIRKGVDPGLVEQVQGNIYRARIYPLPPDGTRTVRITYVTDLAVDGTSAAYHLPLAHADKVGQVSLRVEIAKTDVVPQISGAIGNLTLAQLRDAFVAEATLPQGTACDDLLVKLPDLPRHLRSVERSGGEAFFAVSSAIPNAVDDWTPRRIALLWDASGSREDVDGDLELLRELFEQWPKLVIDVRVLRDTLSGNTRSFAGKAERDALISFLMARARDGGTGLAGFDPAVLPNDEDEAWLVLSDGLNTIGRGTPGPSPVPIIACSSVARSDSAYLRHLATASGGVYIDLLQTRVQAAVKLVATANQSLRVTGTSGCADVHVTRAAGRLSIVGRLTSDIGQVMLDGSGAPGDHISIPRSAAIEGHVVARAWAGQQTRALAVANADGAEILALARRHGVVTANASLLVLDTLEQHLEHGIEPAASRTKLHAEYVKRRGEVEGRVKAAKTQHIEQVVALWNARVAWWDTKFTPRAPGPPEMTTRSGSLGTRSGAVDLMMSAAPAMAAAPPPMLRSPAPGAPPAAAGGPAAGAAAKAEPPTPSGPTIQIKPWSANAPYLLELRNSADPYATYCARKREYAASPSFFLDCGDFFLGRGEQAIGRRVLSNLLELGLDDPALMRMYAWRLQAAGVLDAAIDVFERVRRMRDDEPQSHRDLALALAERWESTRAEPDIVRAMDLLYDVVERAWERFPEIELIALMELNRLIAKAGEHGVATPARIDRRLIRLLDLDVRISMSWDLDLTDVDLHVFEPNGEHAYYGQNQTSGGGLVSRDFREGYGPEEYVCRRAAPGVYTVKAHYYGSHQQDIAGACTVIVHVTTNFARANEQRQVLTLRLDRPSDQVEVGKITFASSTPPPVEWKARFKKLRLGMSIDEVTSVVGQPARTEGTDQTVLVYEPAPGIIIHVILGPRLTGVKQIMDGAALDLVP